MRKYLKSSAMLIYLFLYISVFYQVQSSSLAEMDEGAQEEEFLDELAKDTWSYLSSDWATDNHLPWSWRSETMSGGDFANPAEIGLYALAWVSAFEMQESWSPSWQEVEAEIVAVLDQLRAWQTGSQVSQPHGPNAYNDSVFYQWYWINWNPPVVGAGSVDHAVPSVDNAWLAASLITLHEYSQANGHAAIAQKTNDIVTDMDFSIWYDSNSHRFYWGAENDPLGGGEADYYSNENRIINFIARTMGDLSAEEFQDSLDSLVQTEGDYNGVIVEKVAWDGSYFTYTSPALFIREMDTEYGRHTIMPATQAQQLYASDQNYVAWGLSDSFDIGTGAYIQQGAPPADSPDPLETHFGVISPHASGMALITPLASEAITNFQTISTTMPLAYHQDYGFLDSVMAQNGDTQFGVPSARFSTLNQLWLFLSIANYKTQFIWTYFYLDPNVMQTHREMYAYDVFLPKVLNP